MSRKLVYVLTWLLCAHCNLALAQQQFDKHGRWINGVSEPWFFDSPLFTKDEAAIAQAKWQQIEGNLGSNGFDEWAGTYIAYTGELHNSYLKWSANSGFVTMGIYTCAASVTNLNYGKVIASTRLVRLIPEVPNRSIKARAGHGSHGPQLLAKRYLPVKWGERHYLVPEKGVAAFYNYVSGLGEYHAESHAPGEDYFVKLADWNKPVSGMPIVPPGYERYVKKPIDATVVAVGKKIIKKVMAADGSIYYESIMPVRLNVGRRHRLRPSMSLHVVGSEQLETVEIVQVGVSTSKGVVTRVLDEEMNESYKDWRSGSGVKKLYPEISVGWRLTTSIAKSSSP